MSTATELAPAPSPRRALLRFQQAALLLAAILTFQVATIRPGQDWGDDFAMYLLHARNIAEGKDYAETGYIYNPEFSSLGPKTYPPVYPLLLSPIYYLFGQNLWVMKLEIAGFFAGALVLLYAALAGRLPDPLLLGVIVTVGLSPAIWDMKESIGSDIPFLFFTFLSLLSFARWQDLDRAGSRQLLRPALVGIAIYLAYGTRSIGLVLVPAIVLCDLLRARRLTRFTGVALGVFLGCAILQNTLVHSDRSYLDQVAEISPSTIAANANHYLIWASMLWDNGHVEIARKVLFFASAIIAAGEFARRVKDGVTIFEVFLAGYVAAILLWPSPQGMRLLLPAVPLLVFYLFAGVGRFTQSLSPQRKAQMWGLVLTTVLLTYAGRYAITDFGPILDGIEKQESQQFFHYLRTQTPADAVVVFSKPRALSLLTGHAAAANRRSASDDEMWSFIRRVNATYLVVGPETMEETHRDHLLQFVARNERRFRQEYANPDFQVFRINDDGPLDHAGTVRRE